MAQTTPKRNRRPINVRQQFQPPLTLVVGEGLSGDTEEVEITLQLEKPVFGPLEDVEWPLDQDGTERLPDSVVLEPDGLLIRLTYSDLPSPGGWQISVPSYSPAFRDRWGAYIAPIRLGFDIPA